MKAIGQLEAKVQWNRSRSKNSADFYTVGYSLYSPTDLLHALREAGVHTLVDIRHDAISMHRPEFSKSNLRHFLGTYGVAYIHCPDLGVPRDVRLRVTRDSNRDIVWRWYDSHVVPSFAGRNLDRFFNCADHPIALMCVEADPSSCHRHRLAIALEHHGLRSYDL